MYCTRHLFASRFHWFWWTIDTKSYDKFVVYRVSGIMHWRPQNGVGRRASPIKAHDAVDVKTAQLRNVNNIYVWRPHTCRTPEPTCRTPEPTSNQFRYTLGPRTDHQSHCGSWWVRETLTPVNYSSKSRCKHWRTACQRMWLAACSDLAVQEDNTPGSTISIHDKYRFLKLLRWRLKPTEY